MIRIIQVIIIIIILLFIKLYIPFGGTPSDNDEKDYEKRANNYKDGKFYNKNEIKMNFFTNEKNSYISAKELKPKDNIPTETPIFKKNDNIENLNITWLGHSTILINISGMTILTDPVFSDYASPFSFIGPKRFSEMPIKIADLPKIDIVLISHDHYDHLDYKTIKLIDDKVDKYIVPLGVENHLERWKINKNKISNMAWWEEININGLLIGCTPSRHSTSRTFLDKDSTLWASYVLINDDYKVFFSGDTGYDEHFKEINKKYGDFDISFLEAGQYNVKWKNLHMTPEESVQAGVDLKAKCIMPIHNSAFVISEHPWDDPLERFVKESEKNNIKYITPIIGETINYNENKSTSHWWKEIK